MDETESGAYVSTKRNYKLSSKLIIHTYFSLLKIKLNEKTGTNKCTQTHSHAIFIRLIQVEMDIEYHHVQTIRSYIARYSIPFMVILYQWLFFSIWMVELIYKLSSKNANANKKNLNCKQSISKPSNRFTDKITCSASESISKNIILFAF